MSVIDWYRNENAQSSQFDIAKNSLQIIKNYVTLRVIYRFLTKHIYPTPTHHEEKTDTACRTYSCFIRHDKSARMRYRTRLQHDTAMGLHTLFALSECFCLSCRSTPFPFFLYIQCASGHPIGIGMDRYHPHCISLSVGKPLYRLAVLHAGKSGHTHHRLHPICLLRHLPQAETSPIANTGISSPSCCKTDNVRSHNRRSTKQQVSIR